MNTVFNARKVTLNDSFKEKAELKLKKLDKFFDEAKAQVTVSSQKDRITLELTLWANGLIFRAERTDEDKLAALDDTIDTIVRQIRKNKTKLLKKIKASALDPAPAELVSDEVEYDVVRTKEVELRPMTLDEAILQMNMLGHSFFVFQNGESGEVNVVYRRNVDGYGVIIPKK